MNAVKNYKSIGTPEDIELERMLILQFNVLFILSKGGLMMRTLQSELINKGIYKASKNKPQPPVKKRKKEKRPKARQKQKEELSTRDVEYLMDKHKPRYKRSKGAFRQF